MNADEPADELCPNNRWAAFSDKELNFLNASIYLASYAFGCPGYRDETGIFEQTGTELERRKGLRFELERPRC
jgi:hypothetical protein